VGAPPSNHRNRLRNFSSTRECCLQLQRSVKRIIRSQPMIRSLCRGDGHVITNRSDLSDEQWLTRLATHHNTEIPHLEILDAYYEGEQPLSYMHPELLRRLDDRVRQVVVNWPELVVDSLDERLDVMGFKLGVQEEADRD